jgi:hypothetical protein
MDQPNSPSKFLSQSLLKERLSHTGLCPNSSSFVHDFVQTLALNFSYMYWLFNAIGKSPMLNNCSGLAEELQLLREKGGEADWYSKQLH